MKTVRYAIAGFGGIAENRIAKEGFAMDSTRFKPLPNARLTGAMDISAARKSAAKKMGLKWFDSVDALCESKDTDAVFVATNNLSHYPIAKQLLEARKHVIIEKPITTTLDHARELMQLASNNDLSLAVDHMMLYNAYNIKASQIIQKGGVGDVSHIVLHMEFPYGFAKEEAATWRCSNPEEVGGPVGDVASHCMYMAEFLLNDTIASVQAVYTPPVIEIKAENGAFINFTTKKNVTGTIRVSFSEPRGSVNGTLLNLGYEVYGSKKTLSTYGTLFQLSGHSDEPLKLRLEIDGRQSAAHKLRVKKEQNIYRMVIQNHARSVMSGPRMSGDDALHNLELVLKVHESAKANGIKIQI
ncbi:gfo/Idh/MocA family oxidoreductase [bacterium]|nr:MAG: gfo/Idh/MocA family oxidoreductase [bacterium]